mmetsp:Transcript_32237/g.49993  ORF Transcript_32237/g.49993 Transcript_32237/m.49993 type:complete len:393 (+) Transcript_32237:203-1381(+)
MSTEPLSLGKYIPLVLTICVTSLFSMLASIAVVRIAHLRLGATYQRYLCMMSAVSILNSTFLLLHPFLIPSDPDYPWAIGGEATCTMVGFIFHFGALMVAFYNATLALYFYYSIQSGPKMQKEPEDIVGWPETFSHLICWLVPAGLAAAAAATDSINFDAGPDMCIISGDDSLADILGYIFAGLAGIAVIISAAVTGAVNSTVVGTLKRGREYGTDAVVDDETKQRLEAVASQAVLYTIAFINSIIWPVVLAVLPSGANGTLYYVFQLLAYLIYPFHGVLNCCIYIRPRFQMLKVMYPDDSFLVVSRVALSMAGDPEEIENVRAYIYGDDYECPSAMDSEDMSANSSLPQEVSFDPNRPLSQTSMVSCPDDSEQPHSDDEGGDEEDKGKSSD